MLGAREYAELFESGRYGKLRIESGSHARGKTFNIFVIQEGVGEVEVYGVIGGQPGWTEWYGWLHKGKWIDDFVEMVEHRKIELANREREFKEEQLRVKKNSDTKRMKILASY